MMTYQVVELGETATSEALSKAECRCGQAGQRSGSARLRAVPSAATPTPTVRRPTGDTADASTRVPRQTLRLL